MKTNAAEHLPRSRPSRPETEPADLAACLAGPRGLDLVVEMAHDLRSPLTSILFLAETIQRERSGPINDRQRRQLGLIRSAALCLCAAASDVLELARGGDRLAEREAASFSIRDLFGAVRDVVTPLAEEKRLALRFEGPERDRRFGHERALSRVLLNLTTNALKFTEQGSVEVVARERDGAHIEFSVSDTGPGLDPETVRTLYQPFRKAPTTARHHFSSSGLGLAICNKLVTALGSQLEVTTRPGRGTRFTFALELPAVPVFVEP
jgi:signal transduction histidine kinase